MQEQLYSIGEVAKLTGASVKTIRYYDEIRLLPPAEISESGYRYYTNREIWRLELILTLRYVGFSVQDIRQVLTGQVEMSTAIDWQIKALSNQIKHLSSIQTILHKAKTSDTGNESLRHIHDIVEIMSTSTEGSNSSCKKCNLPLSSPKYRRFRRNKCYNPSPRKFRKTEN